MFSQILNKIKIFLGLNKTLYVGNFPYSASKNELEELFKDCGPVEKFKIIRDNRTKRSKGYGFITFKNHADCKNALNLSGKQFKGRTIKVRYSS